MEPVWIIIINQNKSSNIYYILYIYIYWSTIRLFLLSTIFDFISTMLLLSITIRLSIWIKKKKEIVTFFGSFTFLFSIFCPTIFKPNLKYKIIIYIYSLEWSNKSERIMSWLVNFFNAGVVHQYSYAHWSYHCTIFFFSFMFDHA